MQTTRTAASAPRQHLGRAAGRRREAASGALERQSRSSKVSVRDAAVPVNLQGCGVGHDSATGAARRANGTVCRRERGVTGGGAARLYSEGCEARMIDAGPGGVRGVTKTRRGDIETQNVTANLV
ncbi:hypothetical protein [Amycolatopsis sp. NPDC051903]|uniref:hypothetical protein n=1 Tax=Amycolatopsis sp. NPDC051903 TaxID=3363936 RepID=UPI00379F976C